VSSEGAPGFNEKFSSREWRAVEVHRYFLSQRFSRFVSMEETIDSWLNQHSARWREEQVRRSTLAQVREMEKHKWIESEKAGLDLGKEAVLDWITKYAETWRKQWEGGQI